MTHHPRSRRSGKVTPALVAAQKRDLAMLRLLRGFGAGKRPDPRTPHTYAALRLISPPHPALPLTSDLSIPSEGTTSYYYYHATPTTPALVAAHTADLELLRLLHTLGAGRHTHSPPPKSLSLNCATHPQT